jgi:ElaB/YqjD/DUF883 family membrane-anchored ribosome-binding protein
MAKTRRASRTRDNERNGNSRLYDDVISLAGTLLRDRKEIGGLRLKELSESVRDMAQTLPDMPNLASYVGSTADSLTDLGNYISDSDLETIAKDANQFARRHPMMTMGIATAAGLAAVTYIKSGYARHTRSGVTRKSSRRTGAARKTVKAGAGKRPANGVARTDHA